MTQLIPILEKTVSPGKNFARIFFAFLSKVCEFENLKWKFSVFRGRPSPFVAAVVVVGVVSLAYDTMLF